MQSHWDFYSFSFLSFSLCLRTSLFVCLPILWLQIIAITSTAQWFLTLFRKLLVSCLVIKKTAVGRSQCNWCDLPSDGSVMGKTNGWVDSLCVYSSHGKLCFVKISIRLREKKPCLVLNHYLKKPPQTHIFKYRSYQKFIWDKIILLVWKQLGILTVQEKNVSGVGGVDITLSLPKITVFNAITIYDM